MEASPTACAISRTDGGKPRARSVAAMKSRILTLRSASCFVTRASLAVHDTERTFDVKDERRARRRTGWRLAARRLVDWRAHGGRRTQGGRGRMARRSANDGTKRAGRALAGASLGRMLSLMAFLPVASRDPRLRPTGDRARPRRADAGRAQGAARGRRRVPRPRARSRARRRPDHRRPRRPRRRRPRGRPVPRRRAATTCSTRSSSSSASTASRSIDDMAQIRRLTPGPVRRTIRRVPGLIARPRTPSANSVSALDVRAWINREDPIT